MIGDHQRTNVAADADAATPVASKGYNNGGDGTTPCGNTNTNIDNTASSWMMRMSSFHLEQPPPPSPSRTLSPRSPIDFDSCVKKNSIISKSAKPSLSSSSGVKSVKFNTPHPSTCSTISSKSALVMEHSSCTNLDVDDEEENHHDDDEFFSAEEYDDNEGVGENDEDDGDDEDDDQSTAEHGHGSPVPVALQAAIPSTGCGGGEVVEPEETKRAPPKKKITFSRKLRVKEIRHLNDYTDDELNALYMTVEDYQLAKGVVKMTVRMMMTNPDLIQDDDPEFCTRGLEFRTKVGSRLRTQNKCRCRSAVLNEQDIQREEGFVDPEFLQLASMDESKIVKEEARQRGVEDEWAVQDYLSDVRQITWSLMSNSRQLQSGWGEGQNGDGGGNAGEKQVKSILIHKI